MFYNLDLFGKKLKKIRKHLCISQKYISEATGVEERTIRRIENAKVLPKLDTLELLSTIYKKDLVSLLIECRFDDYLTFNEIKKNIESKIDGEQQFDLYSEMQALSSLLSCVENTYYRKNIVQFILFTDGAILYKNNIYDLAFNKFIESIKITIHDFNLDNYYKFVYSSTEIRILMNLAFIINKSGNSKRYIEILNFCMDSIDPTDEIYPKVCHNLSGAYRRNNNFEKALELSINAIDASRKNNNLSGLSILYYGKGFSEYHLVNHDYLKSFNLSISLCEAFGQHVLKKNIVDNCKNLFNIILIS